MGENAKYQVRKLIFYLKCNAESLQVFEQRGSVYERIVKIMCLEKIILTMVGSIDYKGEMPKRENLVRKLLQLSKKEAMQD